MRHSRVDAGGFAHLANRDAVETTRGEQAFGRVEDRLAGLLAASGLGAPAKFSRRRVRVHAGGIKRFPAAVDGSKAR